LTLNVRVLRQPVVEIGFFVAMAALTAVLAAACGRAPASVARAARIAFYYLAIPLTFEMVGRVVPYVSPDSRESWLLRADKLLFGSDPTRWIGWQEHAPALTELFQWVYSSFYFLPALLAIRLTFLRKFAAIDHVLLVVVLGFLISYLGYFLVPARSPYRLFHYPFELRGLWATPRLREWLTILEDQRYDVFPSGHSDVTFLVAACAWKYDRKSFFAFFGPVAILLPLGTVYLRYHYAVDVVAGAFFAVLTWRLAASLRGAAKPISDGRAPGDRRNPSDIDWVDS
jgi:membrane-associated phospholipid phosphatase